MSSRGKELAKNTIIVSIGRICTQGISFLLLPLYTAKLTTEQYGTVDLLNTYITLLIPIIIFEIQQAVFRYLIDVRKEEEEKKILISSTFFSCILQSIIFLIIYTAISKWIINDYKYFLATNVVATIFSTIMLQISRGLGDNKTYSIGSFITASMTIILNVIFILIFNFGAYGMLMASLIANILCALYIVIRLNLISYIRTKYFSFNKLREMWRYSVPLIPNSISWWIMAASDRTIITSYLGVESNGIYSVANKFSSIFNTLYGIFNITWTESVSVHIHDEDASDYFSKMINKLFKLFASLCFGIITCMPFIFPILINESFSEAYNQIPILMFGALCNVMVILVSGLYIAKKMTKQVTQTSFFSAIINIIINFLLIRYIGIYAASVSTFVAYFIMMIVRMFNIKKHIDIQYDKKSLGYISIISIGILISYYINNIVVNIIALVVAIIYAIIVNKDMIKMLKNMIKKENRK